MHLVAQLELTTDNSSRSSHQRNFTECFYCFSPSSKGKGMSLGLRKLLKAAKRPAKNAILLLFPGQEHFFT